MQSLLGRIQISQNYEGHMICPLLSSPEFNSLPLHKQSESQMNEARKVVKLFEFLA